MCGAVLRRIEAHGLSALARFWSAIGLAVGLILGGAVACRNEQGTAAEIEFWAMGREGEAVAALLPAFRQRYPEIRVSAQQIPWNAAHEKLLTAYVGNALPDVFQLGNTWIPEFAAIGALEILDERWAGAVASEDFFPGILETNRLEGRLYGVPWYADTRLLFYRTDLLRAMGYREAPRTWQQWWSAMDRIQTAVGFQGHALLLPVDEWQMPVILALQVGSTLLRNGDRYGDFRGSAFRRAFEAYLQVFRRGWAPPLGQTQLGNLYQDFGRGLFVFHVTGPWNLGEFTRRLPLDAQGKWTTAPLPAAGEDYPGVSIAGGSSLVMAKRSRQKDAAWKLIEFFAEPAQQLAFYRLTGDLPPRRTPWEDPMLAANPKARAFRIQLEHTVPLPRIPEWERIAARIARYAQKVIRGELDVDLAVVFLDRDVDAILEKRRWLLDQRKQ